MPVLQTEQKYVQRGPWPVGCRLTQFVDNWRYLGASNYILNVLTQGYRLPFNAQPELSTTPLLTSEYANPIKQSLLREAIEALLRKQAIEKVENIQSPGFYSRLFLVPKASGGWRPVIDLSVLNSFLDVPSFKMETPESIRNELNMGEWTTSIDLTDAYLHIPVHPRYRKYLRFKTRTDVYQFCATPFGLATIPLLFTRLGKEIKKLAARMGWALHTYLDDMLIKAGNYQVCLTSTQGVEHLLLMLGWILNLEKSDKIPKQRFVFVGYGYNLRQGLVFVPPERVQKMTILVHDVINSQNITARTLMCVLGTLAAMEKLVHLGRLHMRPIQWHLKEHWNNSKHLDHSVPVTTALRQALKWWLRRDNLAKPCSLHPKTPQVEVYSDASLQGWGAHCGQQTAFGLWDQMWLGKHINVLELQAVRLALQRFLPLLQGRTVLVQTDNSTVQAYLAKQGGTHSKELCQISQEILLWAEQQQISITAQYIQGERNVLADALSRQGQLLKGEWSLNQSVFNQLCALWGTPQIDMFATSWNHKLPKFVSPMREPKAWKTDALSLVWNNMYLYMYPPTTLWNRIMPKLSQEKPRALVIAPWWPTQSWWSTLLLWSIQPAIPLPFRADLLTQPHSGAHCTSLSMLNLHAWLIQPGHTQLSPSLMKWRNESRRLSESQPAKCIQLK